MAKKKETMTEKQIDEKVLELSEKLRTIRFSIAGSRPKNVKEQGNTRREIARLLTQKATLAQK